VSPTAGGVGSEQPYGDLVAVVTGASRGIGAGLAGHFAEQGIRLGLCARSVPVVPEGSDAYPAAVDVADAAAVDAFAARVVARFGRIDLWVNNAGVLEPMGPLADADLSAIERNVTTNVLGVMYGSATFARHVRGRPGDGTLVNMSSGAATKAYRGWAAYCGSKAAVEMVTEVVGLEEKGSGLRAYAVSPGVVDTGMQALIRSTPPSSFPDVERFQQLADEDEFATPEWVARWILEWCVDPVTRLTPDAGRGSVSLRIPDQDGEV